MNLFLCCILFLVEQKDKRILFFSSSIKGNKQFFFWSNRIYSLIDSMFENKKFRQIIHVSKYNNWKQKKQIIAPNINFIIIDILRTLLLWINRKQIALFYQFYDKYTPRKELWHFFCMYMWHIVLQKFFFWINMSYIFGYSHNEKSSPTWNSSGKYFFHQNVSYWRIIFRFFLCTKQLWLHPLNTANFFSINTAKL